MVKVEFTLMKAGYCYAHEHIMIRNGRRKKIVVDATFARIKHPEHGYILFDTGYSRRFYEVTRKFPERLYAVATPVTIDEKSEAKSQLLSESINPSDVRHIIISHLHADHVAGLRAFDQATFHCSEEAIKYYKSSSRFGAVRHGVLKSLFPEDFLSRVSPVVFSPGTEIPHLGNCTDLFGDGSIRLVNLPGHARGQIGALLDTTRGQVFLAADCCLLSESYRHMILPSSVMRVFIDSWGAMKVTLKAVHEYHLANPDVLIIPTHCRATTEPLINGGEV